jgi:hypothetical protein
VIRLEVGSPGGLAVTAGGKGAEAAAAAVEEDILSAIAALCHTCLP